MDALKCYRCGHALAALSLPLRRLEECPECRAHLHVCRMCVNFAPRLPSGCSEQDAPEVRDKASANFCDFFKPSPTAFDPAWSRAATRAHADLEALFGGTAPPAGSPAADEPDAALAKARALFEK